MKNNHILLIGLFVVVILVISTFVLIDNDNNKENGDSVEQSDLRELLIDSDQDGGIRAEIIWENPGESKPEFNVSLDTHSGDLTQYDLEEYVTLSIGDSNYNLLWELETKSSHHPSGALAVDEEINVFEEHSNDIMTITIENLDKAEDMKFSFNLEEISESLKGGQFNDE